MCSVGSLHLRIVILISVLISRRRKDRHEASGFSRRPDPDSDEDEDYERERRKRSKEILVAEYGLGWTL